jgi:hypothetical protein
MPLEATLEDQENENGFFDDYDAIQELVLSHFSALRGNGAKVNLRQITRALAISLTGEEGAGEEEGSECHSSDDISKEIDAARVLALSDRDAALARFEELQAVVLMKDSEIMNLKREALQLREFLKGFENQRLLHELSVEQHCQDLVADLSHCRGDLLSHFEDQRQVHQLRSDYEHASDHLRECRQSLEVPPLSLSPSLCPSFPLHLSRQQSRQDAATPSSCPNLETCSADESSASLPHCLGLLVGQTRRALASKLTALWPQLDRLMMFVNEEAVAPLTLLLSEIYESHLHPLYLAHLHPIAQVAHRQALHLLNTAPMVEALAYGDYIIRKGHVFFYRLLEVELPRYRLFLSIVCHRILWNADRLIEKVAVSLSRLPLSALLSAGEWYAILNLSLGLLLLWAVFALRKVAWAMVCRVVAIVTYPLRRLFGLTQQTKPMAMEERAVNDSDHRPPALSPP